MLRSLTFIAALIAFAASAASEVPGAKDVQAVTLSNGMQIIVWPDRDDAAARSCAASRGRRS